MSEREILFRGKRCDNGEWVEGLPIKTYDTELGTEIGKNFRTSAMVGIPHGMFDLGDRVVGDVFYCCDCVASWAERNGKPFDEQYKEPWKMFKRWWNRTVKEQAEKEGKEVKTYHRTVTGGFAEGE